MLHKVKLWLQSKKILENEIPLQQKIDSIDHQQHKKQVAGQFQLCSMLQHESTCDIFSCKGGCFMNVADKIVGEEYKVDKKTRKRIE